MRLRYILLLICLRPFASAPLAAAEIQEDRPNVIVICADDLGYGDLGCYGHPKHKTPRIDRMAREGARLTHFYSNCGYCAPSRAALMTGRYPFHCGMLRNPHPQADYGGPGDADHVGLPVDEVTLGQVFQAAGYQTACIGKWHLGHQPQFHPIRRGFHHYFGILYSNDMHPVELYEGEDRVEFPVDQSTLTARYTARSLDFIRDNQQRPFFLYLAHTMPHKPLAASNAFLKKSDGGLYADVMAELDASVGQVLDELARLRLDRRTLVVLTSDNGPWFGGSTGGLRGMKSTWWEGGVRVPLIAYWPGRIPAAHVSPQVGMLMDLFPTLLQAAGLPLPTTKRLDGRDLMPVLTSSAPTPHDATFIYQNGIRSVREGKWKLHFGGTPPIEVVGRHWIDPRAPNGTTLLAPREQFGPDQYPGVKAGDVSSTHALFNLEVDPAEQHNVIAQHPDIARRLQKRVQDAQGQEFVLHDEK